MRVWRACSLSDPAIDGVTVEAGSFGDLGDAVALREGLGSLRLHSGERGEEESVIEECVPDDEGSTGSGAESAISGGFVVFSID